MNILHLDSSITGDNSTSRKLSAEVVAKLKAANPSAQVVYRDLVANPIEHLTLPAYGEPLSAELMAEFQAADTIVMGVPMYNFGTSSQLRAWFDRVLVAGVTFKYGPEGVQGLAGGKRVIVAASRGGYYGEGTPAASMEHQVSYVKALLGFIGITDVDVVVAEGQAVGADAKAAGIANAEAAIAGLAA
ncbi:MAG: FMN-dependent NADH-azoreductase [Pseudomonas fluorescens]|nr:MAG: FMN-dependent NADH-azoreductase [Pseudomonas fluorescens]